MMRFSRYLYGTALCFSDLFQKHHQPFVFFQKQLSIEVTSQLGVIGATRRGYAQYQHSVPAVEFRGHMKPHWNTSTILMESARTMCSDGRYLFVHDHTGYCHTQR
jgi:hypothetical protein